MNLLARTITAAVVAALSISPAFAANQASRAVADDLHGSADVPLPKASTSIRSAVGAAPSASPSADDVGDADSFGRSLTWLGLADGSVELSPDCSSGAEHCQVLAPAPAATAFAFDDIGRITLPRNATHSLLCYWFSPVLMIDYDNPTASPATARLSYVPTVTVENPVLDDPTLIDPNTGLPFGGSLLTGLTSSERFEVPLAAGQHLFERERDSSVCIAGLLSRQTLVQNYGLSEAQAREFFRKPTTLRLNIEGSAQFVGDASLYFGLRVVGD
ncbi:hypothetical protein [Dokdonella sp.]|uniref:hypothetical protein n=1 Tax=Dokdonella sp. TaxID=2291710 RepID=UPI002F3E83D9